MLFESVFMKIGLAIYNFNPKKGGAERYTYDLSSMLSKRGHDVFVFCADGVEASGVTLVRLNTTHFPRWLRSLSFAMNHKKQVRQFGLDVVLGFGNTLDLDVFQSHGGIQRVWMEREIASYDNPRERQLKAFLLKNSMNQKTQQWIAEWPIRQNKYRRIVAISDMIKKQMMDYYKISENSVDVVYNGVDINRFSPSRIEQGGPLKILFSAGNFRLKGLSPLLSALGELAKETKSFQLLIMGRGRKERYKALIEKLNIQDCVTFLGERANPETIYQEAHILAHPTFYDACSLTTMEAMASGLPTITTKWNGASALISPDEGYVIDEPRNTAALCDAIRNLFDKDKRQRMGEAARLKMEKYTMERNMEQIEKILFEAASTSGH
jgi:UDP-glucose:(heptosyl)LPS alpha-1,3-glucosyltransferase